MKRVVRWVVVQKKACWEGKRSHLEVRMIALEGFVVVETAVLGC